MNEYIKQTIENESNSICLTCIHRLVCKAIDNQPCTECNQYQNADDVAEVRHGRWLTTDAYPHHLYCSVCYKTYAKNAKWVNELDLPTNYCPNCGALMREVGNGEK